MFAIIFNNAELFPLTTLFNSFFEYFMPNIFKASLITFQLFNRVFYDILSKYFSLKTNSFNLGAQSFLIS